MLADQLKVSMIKEWIQGSIKVLGIIGVIIILESLQMGKLYSQHGIHGTVIFSIAYVIIMLFISAKGIIHSYWKFGCYMSIRAQRGSYLKHIVIIDLLGVLGVSSITYGVERGISQLITHWSNQVWEQTGVIELEQIIGLSLVVYCTGFFIGALFYRMRKIIALCVIGSVPILLLAMVLAELIFENEVTYIILTTAMYCVGQLLECGGQMIYSVILLVGAILLLREAPIPKYKHDLL